MRSGAHAESRPNTSFEEHTSRMTDEQSAIEPLAKRVVGPFNPLTATLPVGALTASVLLDALALVAENPAQAQSYQRGACDILTVGMSGSIVSAALEIVDYLRAETADEGASRAFALNGATLAVYLLDVATRRAASDLGTRKRTAGDALPTGLSLLGLVLLAIAGKRP